MQIAIRSLLHKRDEELQMNIFPPYYISIAHRVHVATIVPCAFGVLYEFSTIYSHEININLKNSITQNHILNKSPK